MPGTHRRVQIVGLGLLLVVGSLLAALGAPSEDPPSARSPDESLPVVGTPEARVIELGLSSRPGRAGGLLVADLNDDGRLDVLVSDPGRLGAYEASGERLWLRNVNIHLTGKAESEGLPGLHAPGASAADVDGDGATEVLFLDQDGSLRVISGASGEPERSITLPTPDRAEQWEHLVVARFRAGGGPDLLLQATNADGYRMGRRLAAYALDRLLGEGPDAALLWQRNDFTAAAHSGARVADLDGDGRDEVLGGDLIGPDGERRVRLSVDGHLDAVHVADVRPDLPGLEVVALEEGRRNRIVLYGLGGLIWVTHFRHQEPQNTAIGDFDLARPGLEIWCRSRYDRHQRPFVFDARGEEIATYALDEVGPPGWTSEGVEEISTIDWTGLPRQLAVAKERHTAGDVGIFDPLSGRFILRITERADRLYVADVIGDWREELLVRSGSRLRIYGNVEPNPNPDRAPLWTLEHYRRSKLTWNYYNT